jgi:hypothetical protein
MPLGGAPTCVIGPIQGRPITPKEHRMNTMYNPDPTGKIPPASGVAHASDKTESSMSSNRPRRRNIGTMALGALALMAGGLAIVASVAAPTASAMKNECYNHVLAGRYAEANGMYQLADLEYQAASVCAGYV